jgi:hypothetical protein
VLKADRKHAAIACDSEYGPNFNAIWVKDNFNANTESSTYLGGTYITDIGLVEEIEVFEITTETTLQSHRFLVRPPSKRSFWLNTFSMNTQSEKKISNLLSSPRSD